MIVKFYWPNCNLNSIETNSQTYFWVGCTVSEAETIVYPLISESMKQESILLYEDRPHNILAKEYGSDSLWFLVSKDASAILSFFWGFPYAGQWNSWNPFKEMDQEFIKTLEELKSLKW